MPEQPAVARLSKLYLHPLNTRSEPPAAEIEALAESIRAVGLLQNLTGFADPERPDEIGIVAGGRRLRALWLLHGQDDPTIPVVVTGDPDIARLWASTENTARMGLHPADEIRAYARHALRGDDPAAIARAYAVSERHVRQRLRLAHLPAEALDALRENRITLDQAGALTAGQDHDAIRTQLDRVLNTTWAVRPADIRAALTEGAVSLRDRRVIYVGLDAYRDAGGRTQEELFGDDGRVLDADILDDLFRQRLERQAAAMVDEGRGTVHVCLDPHVKWELRENLRSLDRIPVELPDADQEELNRLQASDLDLTAEEEERLEELEARAAGGYDPDELAASTSWIYVNHQGELCSAGPYVPRATTGRSDRDDDAAPRAESIPQNLRDDLGHIRTLAIQAALLDRPELVLDLLAVTLARQVKPWRAPLALSPTEQTVTPSKPDGTAVPPRILDILDDPRPRGGDLTLAEALAEVRGVPKRERNALITLGLARTFCRSSQEEGAEIAGLAGADVRSVWTPTAEGYFKRLPVGMLDAIWAELVPEPAQTASGFHTEKKAAKAQLLHDLFAGAGPVIGHLSREERAAVDRWLPPELLWQRPADDEQEDEDRDDLEEESAA